MKKIYLNENVFKKLVNGELIFLKENRLKNLIKYEDNEFIIFTPPNYPENKFAIHDKKIRGQTYTFDFEKGLFFYGTNRPTKEIGGNRINFTENERLSKLFDFMINNYALNDYRITHDYPEYGTLVAQWYKNGLLGLMDENGRWLVEPEYYRIGKPEISITGNELMFVTSDISFGIYDAIHQEWIYEPIYNKRDEEILPYWYRGEDNID